jgi:hypothetical protein
MLSLYVDPHTGEQHIHNTYLSKDKKQQGQLATDDDTSTTTDTDDSCSTGSTRDVKFSEANQRRLKASPPLPLRVQSDDDDDDDKESCSFMKNGKPHCTRTAPDGSSYNPCPLIDPSEYSVCTQTGSDGKTHHRCQASDSTPTTQVDDAQGSCTYHDWEDIKGSCSGPCDGQAQKRQKAEPKNPGKGCKTQYRKVPCVVGSPCKCHRSDLKLGNNIQTCSGTKCRNASPGDKCIVGCSNPKIEALMGPNEFTCTRGKWESNKHSTMAQDQPDPTCTQALRTCPNLRGDMRYHISSTYEDSTNTGIVYKPSICVQARKGDKCHIFCRNGYTSQSADPTKPGHGMLLTCKENSSSGKMYWSPSPDSKCKCTPCDANGNPNDKHQGDMCCPNPD